MQVGTLAALWRYPVKSLKAEPLQRVAVLSDGLEGDRTAALTVETPTHARAGKPYRGKENNRLHLTSDPETAASYARDRHVDVGLDRARPRWFDARPVSVLLDLWVRDVETLLGASLDPLRWRPNLYVVADPAFARREADLVGATLRIGGATLDVVATIDRCVTPNYDVATGEENADVLRRIANDRDNVMGIYCEVTVTGDIAVGETLTLT
ncbi:MAG TPA: hypothetical protein VFB22_08535 [Candidatus Baltobacteraceae bacterium]|nr:hypothetical protein [Candidatus Baltobacteraceae bacterium]